MFVISIDVTLAILVILYLVMLGVFIEGCRYGKFKERIVDFGLVSFIIIGSVVNDFIIGRSLVFSCIIFAVALCMLIYTIYSLWKIYKSKKDE